MGWTTPATWVAGTVVTASDMNTYIRDNQLYLKGVGQVPTIESGLTIDNTDGDERLLLPLLSTAECTTVLNAEGEVAFDEQTHTPKYYNGSTIKDIGDHGSLNGLTDDDHTQYQKSNLLTTQGDMPYATGASTWARLPKGTSLQILRMNSGATAPEWATGANITYSYKVSDQLQNSNDTERSNSGTSYTKIKEVKLNADLAYCRIKFDLGGAGGTFTRFGRIYKNGVAIGTEQTQESPTYVTYSEDFDTFVTDDLIQIYVKADAGGDEIAKVRNMRFYYSDFIDSIEARDLYDDTFIELDGNAISVTNQDP